MGVICPSCRRVLRIPSPDEQTPALVVPLPLPENRGRGKRRRRRSRRGKSEQWESEHRTSAGGSRTETRHMRWMLAGGSVLLALCVALVTRAMLGESGGDGAGSLDGGGGGTTVEVPVTAAISDAAFLSLAEPLATQFLSATRVDELLPLVRNPQQAEARMRAFHGGDAIDPEGLAAFNTRNEVQRQDPFISVIVRTGDYFEKNMAFVKTPDGLRIDWESWAGWSPVPWRDFLASKPASPAHFRVNLRPVEYYNFGFSDDRKWRSYRLDSPDGEHSLYGYVERGSVVDSMIQLPPEIRTAPLTLLLGFPEGVESRNQVVIQQVLSENWLIENEESP